MPDTGNDSLGLLRWGARRYGVVLLLCALAFAALATVLESRRGETYETSALVVAKTADNLRPEILPRFGEDIFSSGAVAAAVAADPRIGGDPKTLVPRRVSVQTEQDSISFGVVGRDANPQRAALLANVAANAYRDELNRVSPNGAKFEIQSLAQVPNEPVDGKQPLWLSQTLGVIAGLVFGLGLVAAFLVLRRPVVSPRALQRLAGAPVLGTVTLPRVQKDVFPGPQGVPGLVPVLRRLTAGQVRTLRFASPPKAEGVRSRVCGMVALAVSRVRPVRLLGPDPLLATLEEPLSQQEPLALPEVRPSGRHGAAARWELTIVDGLDAGDWMELGDEVDARIVLVVPEGTPAARVSLTTDDFLEDELYGAILVRPSRRRSQEPLRTPRGHVRPEDSDDGAGTPDAVATADAPAPSTDDASRPLIGSIGPVRRMGTNPR